MNISPSIGSAVGASVSFLGRLWIRHRQAELIHKATVAAKVLADIASRVAAGGLMPA